MFVLVVRVDVFVLTGVIDSLGIRVVTFELVGCSGISLSNGDCFRV